MMLLPIVDSCPQSWSVDTHSGTVKEIKDAFSDYRAPAFIEYLERGWCRLEMFFNAHMPIISRRKKLFCGPLRRVMEEEGRRPHLLFGTREKERGEAPMILRALRDDEFSRFHPAHGDLHKVTDKEIIGAYVQQLCKININLRVRAALYLYVHVYIHAHVRIHPLVYMHTHIFMYIHLCIYMRETHVRLRDVHCTFVKAKTTICICMHACVYVQVYTCIHSHEYTVMSTY
jgi:hypothetical protein